MRVETITTDSNEYEVWLVVAEHNDQAVWEIHIDGRFVAISDWVDFDDSLDQAEKLIEDLESDVASGKFNDTDKAVQALYEQFSRLSGHAKAVLA